MSESQLVAYFRDLPTENQHLCGRFRDDQLQKNYDIESWFPEWNVTNQILNCEIPVTQFRNHPHPIYLPLIRKMKMVRNMTIAVLTFAFVKTSCGQQKQIHGQVLDEAGSPLPGVNILVKNAKKGIISDVDGKYNLIVDKKDTLVFSFVGFKRNELIIKETENAITMKEDAQFLGEVVVVGYTRTMGKMMTGGMVAVSENYKTHNNENLFDSQEKDLQKYPTQIKALGNPTITNELIIVPQIHEKTVFVNSEEKYLAEKWYLENAFQNVESVDVYDLSGRIFESVFVKINDGKIKVNLKNIPSGMIVVRVTYRNERSLEVLEHSAVRVFINQ